MLIKRRTLLGGVAGLAAANIDGLARAVAVPGGTIRIGCITALTGPQEPLGRSILNGAQIAVDEINADGGALGRSLQVIEGDAHADPRRGVELARAMVRQGINLFCGGVTSDEALALTEVLEPLDAVLITCSAQSDRLTHEAFCPNFFRVTDQTMMRNRAQARLMAERYPDVKRWGALLPDNEYGRSAWAAFRDGLLSAYPDLAGREPLLDEPTRVRFGESDFSAQIVDLRRNGADGLFVAVYGDDARSFYKQADQSQLFDNTAAMADSFNELLVPITLGSRTPQHLWLGMTWYFGGYKDLAVSRRLYGEYLRRTGNGLPHGLVSAGHSAIHAYAKAIEAAKGATTARVVAGLSGLTLDTAKGPLTFRKEDHQAVCDVNMVRIKSSSAPATMDVLDCSRPDIEVAEFVRYDGAQVIEPPTPGRALAHHA